MAFQHFYARVPAKRSLFQRTDGYDTFAYSKALNREYIESNLSQIYDNMPTPSVMESIRLGTLQPIFLQYITPNGDLVQSKMGFEQEDFTKERSAYFVHSLVLSKEDRKKVYHDVEHILIDPNSFVPDLSSFSLNTTQGRNNTTYPEFEFHNAELPDLKEFQASYNKDMLKATIYAVLQAASSKGKPLFIYLPEEESTISLQALEFFNALTAIFPSQVKQNLTFCSHAYDLSRFGAFRVRFIPRTHPIIPSAKGVTINFITFECNGIKKEDIQENSILVNFFYSLFSSTDLRRDFLQFCENLCKNDSKLDLSNIKFLYNAVMLFCVCSGYFTEQDVLPNDDSVSEFLAIYAKHRNSLDLEHRVKALKCLDRYPQNHLPFPKAAFSAFSKIYETEPVAAQYVIMNDCLKLLHTDIMREKLFKFIEAHFKEENPGMKSMICQDLANVFYGGFLQPGILRLFAESFQEFEESTQQYVLKKVLSQIRTKTISNQIIEFFSMQYTSFNEDLKELFYKTVLQELADGDDISLALVNMLDSILPNEVAEQQASVIDRIYKLVVRETKKKELKFSLVLLKTKGFVFTSIFAILLSFDGTEKVLYPILQLTKEVSFEKCIPVYVQIWNSSKNPENVSKYSELLLKVIGEAAPSCMLSTILQAHVNLDPIKDSDFANSFDRVVLLPLLDANVSSLWKQDLNVLLSLRDFTKLYPDVLAWDSFAPINHVLKIYSALEHLQVEELEEPIQQLATFDEHKQIGYFLDRAMTKTIQVQLPWIVAKLYGQALYKDAPNDPQIIDVMREKLQAEKEERGENLVLLPQEQLELTRLLLEAHFVLVAFLPSLETTLLKEESRLLDVLKETLQMKKNTRQVLEKEALSHAQNQKEFSIAILRVMEKAQPQTGLFSIFKKK